MRILLLTQWFEPEPCFKGLSFAKALKQAGNEVTVITGFPNYPGGKLYPGYKLKLYQKEIIDGVTMKRVYLYPSHDASKVGRILNYLSFCLSATLCGLFTRKKYDVIYAYHPPLTVGVAASIISFVRRTPFVYDIQDMWPDTLRSTGMLSNEKILRIISKVCLWVYKRATHIVVLSPGFKGLLIKRGVSAKKIDIIYNWCEEDALRKVAATDLVNLGENKFNIVFAGNMGKAQALDTILQVAEKLQVIKPQIQFVFVGAGLEVETLSATVEKKQLNNVLFLPRMPLNKIGTVLYAADVLLVHLQDDPLFSITIPSKTQAYLYVGKPILMAVQGDAAEIILQADAGCVALPEDVEGIASAVVKLGELSSTELKLMGSRGFDYYENNMSFTIGVQKFIEIFEKTIGKMEI